MAETSDKDDKKKLSLSGKGTLSLGKAPSTLGPRPGIAMGRSAKPVAVEVRKKRGAAAEIAKQHAEDRAAAESDTRFTGTEREARARALHQSQTTPKDSSPAYQTKLVVKGMETEDTVEEPATPVPSKTPAELAREQELAKLRKINEAEDLARGKRDTGIRKPATTTTTPSVAGRPAPPGSPLEDQSRRLGVRKDDHYGNDDSNTSPGKKLAGVSHYGAARRRSSGKITVNQILNDTTGEREARSRSLAAQRRAHSRMKAKMSAPQEKTKQLRDVIIPEVITVQELANRMSERVGDVVKKLMGLGIMATANQSIDADTAELVVHEFGHPFKRVSESDVEIGIHGTEDTDLNLLPRPPVVTIMGHVDHGKTSLLDAIRTADVAAHEAGGITQHIGAYQIQTGSGKKITFIDTPGHAAFTEMRARGADVTDIVVLVVAADDSVMPQTVEAISHAKLAGKPIIVAINKCDLPDADPRKVRTALLQHDIVTEDMGGDTQYVEVSAKTKKGLDLLEDAILLQAEVLHLRSNPGRAAQGSVIEARLEQGKGAVATVLIQKGTLKTGDIFVTGTEYGRVRALANDRGHALKEALPGQPVEVLGLNGAPEAGDDFVVVENDAQAREISEFRLRKKRALANAKTKKSGIDVMIQGIQAGIARTLPVIIKGDVHGSVEAIGSALKKLTEENKEVRVQVLHSGVGAITESDISLANASKALIIGFNVRANPQARDLAKRDGVEIRYYSIIYEVIDEVKALLGGLLSPEVKEKFIGYAEIRQVFTVTKAGKIAGCFVTEGQVKRGAKVRLLRDNVVIHEGTLKTLKRFKDEVRDVQKGYECGMAFESYDDIKEGDVIEAFEIESTARTLGGTA